MSLFDTIKGWFGQKPPAEPEPAREHTAVVLDQMDAPPPDPMNEAGKAPRRRTTPQDDAQLEREGRALFDADKAGDAIALLSTRGILFARHDTGSLPCLCKRCLRPELCTAESGGVAYVRDFVVTRHRVFFYWMPEELTADAKRLRASMRGELRHRLLVLASYEPAREGINPFTKERIEIPAKGEPRRRLIDPFTGKPIP